jgi:exodeoxyribonuclease VII small subunit
MAKESKDANGDVATLPFEKALAELETIVQKLEGGNVPLEDSIRIYERGEVLKARCEALLKDAEARVEKITLDAKGKPSGSTPLDQ